MWAHCFAVVMSYRSANWKRKFPLSTRNWLLKINKVVKQISTSISFPPYDGFSWMNFLWCAQRVETRGEWKYQRCLHRAVWRIRARALELKVHNTRMQFSIFASQHYLCSRTREFASLLGATLFFFVRRASTFFREFISQRENRAINLDALRSCHILF